MVWSVLDSHFVLRPVNWSAYGALVALIEAKFLGFLDLHHFGVVHDDLNDAEVEGSNGLLHQLDPFWWNGLVLNFSRLLCPAHRGTMERLHNNVNYLDRDLLITA